MLLKKIKTQIYDPPSFSTIRIKGLWRSTVTDMDFCLVHGKSHDNRGYYLIPFNGAINGKIVRDGYFTGKSTVAKNATVQNQTLNKRDLFLKQLKNWSLFNW